MAPGSPDNGVKPIEVSKDKPFLTAQIDAPEPRWRRMRFRDCGDCRGLLGIRGRVVKTYLFEVGGDSAEDECV